MKTSFFVIFFCIISNIYCQDAEVINKVNYIINRNLNLQIPFISVESLVIQQAGDYYFSKFENEKNYIVKDLKAEISYDKNPSFDKNKKTSEIIEILRSRNIDSDLSYKIQFDSLHRIVDYSHPSQGIFRFVYFKDSISETIEKDDELVSYVHVFRDNEYIKTKNDSVVGFARFNTNNLITETSKYLFNYEFSDQIIVHVKKKTKDRIALDFFINKDSGLLEKLLITSNQKTDVYKYNYDALNRLLSVNENGVSSEFFSYDLTNFNKQIKILNTFDKSLTLSLISDNYVECFNLSKDTNNKYFDFVYTINSFFEE